MAVRVIAIWVLLRPATIAIESHSDMAWSAREVEAANNPRLIERIEQGFNSPTNTF